MTTSWSLRNQQGLWKRGGAQQLDRFQQPGPHAVWPADVISGADHFLREPPIQSPLRCFTPCALRVTKARRVVSAAWAKVAQVESEPTSCCAARSDTRPQRHRWR